ncbi:MAG: fibronectin type III domain-containing protein [Desulfobacterota bacterium]|jgi:hypothetical protein|nr:fibronectin type III domain-containing protein [Thermodesulfobacteriota bacterium]
MPHRLSFLKTTLWILTGLFLAGLPAACGKKANPVVPVKLVPQTVNDLAYGVQGAALVLTWTPIKTHTDGSPLTDLKGYSVQRGEFPLKDYCATCPDQFQDRLWLDPQGPELPGIRMEADRIALTYDQLRPGNVYLFQVRAVNKQGIAGEASKTLKVTWDIPLGPPVLTGLKLRSEGVEVRWEAPKTLVDGSPAPAPAGYLVFRQAPGGSWERITGEPVKEPPWVDAQVQEGLSYAYQVKALRSTNGHLLESAGSAENQVLFKRVVPPPVVQELLAVTTPQAVQLRWQGLTGQPVQGYHVYRRTTREKTPQKLTREPLATTLFEDRQIQPGAAYYYSVSAVGPAPHFAEGERSQETAITYNP